MPHWYTIDAKLQLLAPITIQRAAELLGLSEKQVVQAVYRSDVLVIRDRRIVNGELVEDPDYGLIYQKEAAVLRQYRVPTLAEIAQRAAEVRRAALLRKRADDDHDSCARTRRNGSRRGR